MKIEKQLPYHVSKIEIIIEGSKLRVENDIDLQCIELTQTIKATQGFVSLATRVFPVNIKAPTMMMEKMSIPMEAMYLRMVKGVSFTSCDSAAEALTSSSDMVVFNDLLFS